MRYTILELRKLFSLPSYKYTFVLIALITSFFNVSPFFRKDTSGLSWANLFTDSFGIILFFTMIGMIIATAQFVYGEYTNRTVQMSLAAGVSRGTFIWGKAFAIIEGTYALVVINSLFSLVLAAFVTFILGEFDPTHLSFPHLIASLLLAPLKILPFMFFSFFMTIMLRASTFPIAFLLLYSTLGELLLTGLLARSSIKRVLDFLPGQIGQPIEAITTNGLSLYNNSAALERIARESSQYALTPQVAIAGITLYVVVLCILSYIFFRKQDLSR